VGGGELSYSTLFRLVLSQPNSIIPENTKLYFSLFIKLPAFLGAFSVAKVGVVQLFLVLLISADG